MTKKTILIIDGDRAFAQALSEQLELSAEYISLYAEDMASGLVRLRDQAVDLVLLNGANDPDVVRQVRTGGFVMPVIVLAEAGEADGDPGGDLEPIDYMSKPLRIGDLLTRIRSLLRAQEQSEDVFLPIGPYRFYAGTKTLVLDDGATNRKVRLTEKETDILKYLHGVGAQVVSREELLTEVWGYNSGVTTHTLETHIYRLRQKIEADPSRAALLVTDAGGYRLVP